ncbi:hypothetical protein [Vitreimonas sp.]|jgi:hypothetical protein|uniref:hypothetical protein n=1 Tax=Vitreimonas sp. TaxID=3069702 RepID=UPI002ED85B0A
MFFANSLGPAEQANPTAQGLYLLLAARFAGRDSAPAHELFMAMETVVRDKNLKMSPAVALDLIAQAGMLRFEAETDTAYFIA